MREVQGASRGKGDQIDDDVGASTAAFMVLSIALGGRDGRGGRCRAVVNSCLPSQRRSSDGGSHVADGRSYSGQWFNGEQHGLGCEHHANGKVTKGFLLLTQCCEIAN